MLRTVIFLLDKHCQGLARLVIAGHLMVLEVEAPVHVVNRVRNLILVSHHSQVEGLKHTRLVHKIPFKEKETHLCVGYYGLSDSPDSKVVSTEPVCAVVGRIVLERK